LGLLVTRPGWSGLWGFTPCPPACLDSGECKQRSQMGWGMRFAQVKEEAEGRGTRSKTHAPTHPAPAIHHHSNNPPTQDLKEPKTYARRTRIHTMQRSAPSPGTVNGST